MMKEKVKDQYTKIISFEEIPIELPDVFRGLYFLETLKTKSRKLISFLNKKQIHSSSLATLLKPLFCSLAEEVDQIILPVIVHEISIAKELGILVGKDSKARYESFFVKESQHTDIAKSVPIRYPLLFKMIESIICNTIQSALNCFYHVVHDLVSLKKNSFIEKDDFLTSLNILSKSDFHLGHCSFLLSFKSGKKIIHKSVDLTLDKLYEEFLLKLNLTHRSIICRVSILHC